MQPTAAKRIDFPAPALADSGAMRVGRIVGLTKEGRILVRFPGHGGKAVPARSLVHRIEADMDAHPEGIPGIFYLEGGDPDRPILMGLIRDTVETAPPGKEVRWNPAKLDRISVDGQSISFRADREIVLQCGKGSIVLGKDGRIVIKGTQIVSRASKTNKLKGATVKIN